jgi:hypothetical protein
VCGSEQPKALPRLKPPTPAPSKDIGTGPGAGAGAGAGAGTGGGGGGGAGAGAGGDAGTGPDPWLLGETEFYQLTVLNNGSVFTETDWERVATIADGQPDPTKVGMFGEVKVALYS